MNVVLGLSVWSLCSPRLLASLHGEYSLTLKITFAYLTYDDVQRIPSLKGQTVIVIKAPAETKLEVPHPEEVDFFFFL